LLILLLLILLLPILLLLCNWLHRPQVPPNILPLNTMIQARCRGPPRRTPVQRTLRSPIPRAACRRSS
jgi:hypothetical protein